MPTPRTGYHTADGTRVPSVTTILGRFKESGALIAWAGKVGYEHYQHVNSSEFWAVNASGGFDDAFALQTLKHPHPMVRYWTIRLLGDRKRVTPEQQAALLALAKTEPNAEVRALGAAGCPALPLRAAAAAAGPFPAVSACAAPVASSKAHAADAAGTARRVSSSVMNTSAIAAGNSKF